jgi:hypothetical protein
MKNFLLLLFILSLGPVTGYAQDPCSVGTAYRNCRACGTAAPSNVKGQKLNVLKNRDAKATNPSKITVEEMRDPAKNASYNANQQVWVTGFVASVVGGGVQETCNCKRNDLRDVHINIVADPSEVGTETKYVIVEFTPRWEHNFHLDDSNYDAMLQKVKDKIEGKWVKFEGWMLYDYIHAPQSESTAPGNATNWRATPWEVHPVTALTVLPGPPH